MSRSLSSPLENTSRVHSPGPMGLRHRGATRSVTTSAESSARFPSQRRNSTLSDTVSEARNSIRSSTDDLFFPRVAKRDDADLPTEESHWHSAPLGLALLPAIAGIFFQNGSAVVTDVTLLVLAAIFLNWSVRLPWDWYRSAQAIRHPNRYYDATEGPLDFDIEERKPASDSPETQHESATRKEHGPSDAASAASKELHIHELVALASCFVFPIIGTWLLHSIRCKLSRPSEGLVSNYNLTIFLLASEIRPFSHLLKMVQARTLHLQRVVASSYDDEKEKIDTNTIADLIKRFEELEAHVAETAAARSSDHTESSGEEQSAARGQELTKAVVTQATADVRQAFQPDIDALTRAVRRYEKRTTVTTLQTESRLRELEMQVHDALSLAAAAQRSRTQYRSLIAVLCEWVYALVYLPVQIFMSLVVLPVQVARKCLQYGRSFLNPSAAGEKHKGKATHSRKSHSPRRSKRGAQQISTDPRGLKPIREQQ
ncbi:hypothetical protein BDV59DRAFT_195087 [Aspergillus ambiguus]|uniref:uncharacterized protein n=1 Tax=Aspergillus ambiguus TaxID=176160 RepID=UPI003CCCDF70